MRGFKAVVLGVAAVFLLVSGQARAAMTGGLASPPNSGEATMSVTLAYSERDVSNDEFDQARSRRFLFKGDFGVGQGVDFYAFLGLSDLSYREADFNGNLGETVGMGLRYSPVTLPDRTRLVFDVQTEYFASDESDVTVRQQAYHAAAYMVGEFGSSGRSGYFYPFAGVRLSYADYENDGGADYKSDRYFGLFGGADVFVNPNVYLSGEFHLFDENAFYLTVGYRF
jgi:hypothetical protein